MSIEPSSAGAGMDCAEIERSLDPLVDGEFDDRERGEANAHLAQCERCRSIVEDHARQRSLLRAKLREAMGSGSPAGSAPEELRDRISSVISRQRRPAWRRVLSPVPLATLAACAAGVAVVLATHSSPDPLIEEAVRKHARDLPLEITASVAAPDSIPSLLSRALDFNSSPPPFHAEGLRLVGGRASHIRDLPAAYMRYELPRGRVGLFIIDDPQRRFGDSGRLVQLGSDTIRMVNSRGYNVAVWRRNEIVYSVVSDLDEADLVRLVETAQ